MAQTPVNGRGSRAATPELVEATNKAETPEPVEAEARLVIRQSCQIHQLENGETLQVSRQLSQLAFAINMKEDCYKLNLKLGAATFE